ncbi:MAG: hypothetical protein K9M51_04175 [Candidatus Gracilibacteria bacterium]|nr:hypothetical protein [Candidatus Gracilibacteria bacterium]
MSFEVPEFSFEPAPEEQGQDPQKLGQIEEMGEQDPEKTKDEVRGLIEQLTSRKLSEIHRWKKEKELVHLFENGAEEIFFQEEGRSGPISSRVLAGKNYEVKQIIFSDVEPEKIKTLIVGPRKTEEKTETFSSREKQEVSQNPLEQKWEEMTPVEKEAVISLKEGRSEFTRLYLKDQDVRKRMDLSKDPKVEKALRRSDKYYQAGMETMEKGDPGDARFLTDLQKAVKNHQEAMDLLLEVGLLYD